MTSYSQFTNIHDFNASDVTNETEIGSKSKEIYFEV